MKKLTPPAAAVMIAGAARVFKGRAYIVGGWVRDAYIGIKSIDVDIEIYGMSISIVKEMLENLELEYDVKQLRTTEE